METSQIVAMPRPWIERLAGGLLSAVVMARLLTPTDAAPTGETLWIAQLALLALLVWGVGVCRSTQCPLRIGWVDAAVGLLCLGHVVGSLVVVSTSGDKRAAMTMLWEWFGIAVTWFLMRMQLVASAERKAMLAVVAAAAVSLSGMGVWQHHFGYAESRRVYEELNSESAALANSGRPRDPQGALDWDRKMHQLRSQFVRYGIPVDDTARMLWEQRLYSAEPIGMFALANTLAGVLVCTSILWLGLLLRASRPVRAGGGSHVEDGRETREVSAASAPVLLDAAVPTWILALGGICTALLLYCFLLTKSRTAFVGLACGLGVWCVASLGFRRARGRRLWLGLAVATAFVLVLVVVATATGGLDQWVVSESTKSLRYRFEYWTSTWQMLMDRPRNWLLGVGPGNFRQNYLPFKLPQSSEEIADPHNLVLDVWSNGGLLALAGLIGICVAGLRPFWIAIYCPRLPMTLTRSASEVVNSLPRWRFGLVWNVPFWSAGIIKAADSPSRRISVTPQSVSRVGLTWGDGILAGALLGHLLVWSLGLGTEETLGLLSVGWLLVVLACRSLFGNEPSPVVCAAAFAALFIHLLGAGGIGMPAISQLLLLVIVLTESRDPDGGWTWELSTRLARPAIVLAGLALFLGCWFTGWAPSIEVRSKIADGTEALLEKGNFSKAEREFVHAAEADPWSSTPYERLAELAFQRWQAADPERPDDFQRSVDWQRQAIARNPRHAGGWRMLGEMYIARFKRTRQPADATAADEAMRQAVVLYPNHALTQSILAESRSLEGRQDEARQIARRALELDAINEHAGHIDKRLSQERLKLMHQLEIEP